MREEPGGATRSLDVGRTPKISNRNRNFIIIGVAVIFLAMGGAGIAYVITQTQEDEHRAASSAAASASASAAAEEKRIADNAAQALRDQATREAARLAEEVAQQRAADEFERQQMEAKGWSSAGDNMYFKYLDHSQFSCGRWQCTFLDVVSMAPNGCPGGIFLAASIDRGAGSIGSTNEMTAGLAKGKPARVKLEDTSNQGDGFQLTRMTCHQ